MRNKIYVITVIIMVSSCIISCGNSGKKNTLKASPDYAEKEVIEIVKETGTDTDAIKVNDEGEFIIDDKSKDVKLEKTVTGEEIATIKTEKGEEIKVVVKTDEKTGEKIIDSSKTITKDNKATLSAKVIETPISMETASATKAATPVPTKSTPTSVPMEKPETSSAKATGTPTPKPTYTPTPVAKPTSEAVVTATPTTKPNNTPTEKPTNTPTPTTHVHDWQAVTEVVHHDEAGHWETVDNSYYDNIYITGYCINARPPISLYEILNEKGLWSWEPEGWDSFSVTKEGHNTYIFFGSIDSWPQYAASAMAEKMREIEITSTTALRNWLVESTYHEDLEDIWIVDKAAYDETVITGYKCSCGAEK